MLVDVGIIGGTGIGERFADLKGMPVHIPTQEGTLRGKLLAIGEKQALLISRHDAGHRVPPHRVNYKAMALGLKQVGAKYCFSTAAVGTLREDWPAGTFIVCSDLLDLTGRNDTLFNRTVQHTDFTEPLFLMRQRGTTNVPRYETVHEIALFRGMGDVVGMTAASEAIVMREAGIDYSCLAIVSNFAAGVAATKLSHQEVVDEMNKSGGKAVEVLQAAVGNLTP